MFYIDFCEQIKPLILRIASEEYVRKVLSFVELFPRDFTIPSLMFESVGSQSGSSPDFGFSAELTDALAEKLFSSFQQIGMANGLLQSAKWENCLQFFRNCLENKFFIKHNLSIAWVEFDIGSSLDWPPSPCLHFLLPRETDIQTLLHDASLLCPEKIPDSLFQTYEKLYKSNFLGAFYPKYVSFMFSRTSELCRFYLYREKIIDSQELKYFILQNGTNQKKKEFVRILNRIYPYLATIGIQLALNDAHDNPIGIECYVSQNQTDRDRNKVWKKILKILLEEEIVFPQKVHAALAWMSHSEDEKNNFRSYVDIIKLSYTSQQTILAKFYLAVRPKQLNLHHLNDLSYACSFFAAEQFVGMP